MRRGFSLIEVLVAALLLFFVLVVVIAPIARSRASVAAAQTRLEAMRLADELIARGRSSFHGEAVRGPRTYLYDLEFHPLEPGLNRVHLEIRWETDRKLVQETYLYGVSS